MKDFSINKKLICCVFCSVAILFLIGTIFSCNKNKSLDQSFEIAGDNKEEILKVIQYYKNDPEKLDAVYFLVSNMKNKHSLVGEDIENFDSVFLILDSLHKSKIKIPVISPVFQAKWDSLVKLHGFPMKYGIEKSYDLKCVKAEYLIENIDAAFKEWKTNNFLKELTFNQFCEYILPHRIKTERLENWRRELNHQYKSFKDTVNAGSRLELAKKLNLELKNLIYLNHTLRAYPFAMKASQMNLSDAMLGIDVSQMQTQPGITSAEVDFYTKNFSAVIVTSSYVYTITIKDVAQYKIHQSNHAASPLSRITEYQNHASFYIVNYNNDQREAGEYALLKMYGNSINITRQNVNSNNSNVELKLNTNNLVISNNPC